MSGVRFKPPKRTPTQRSHLERLVGDYGRAHGIAVDRARRWLSVMSLVGVLESAADENGPRFLVKGGISMEVRLGLRARTTRDVDVVFRGEPEEMLVVLERALEELYGRFSFRRKSPVEDIRDTGTRRLALQVGFAGRAWQTLQVEVAKPEATEIELVPVAVGLDDFRLDSPEHVACLSLRYQVAQKLHAVTELPEDRMNHRHWDLVDLLLLRGLLGDDLASVRQACAETFEARGRHAWPPDLIVPAEWQVPYAATVADLPGDLPDEVDAAATEVRGFIEAIDSSARVR